MECVVDALSVHNCGFVMKFGLLLKVLWKMGWKWISWFGWV